MRCFGPECIAPKLGSSRRALQQDPSAFFRIQSASDASSCLAMSRATISGCGLGLPSCMRPTDQGSLVCGQMIDLVPCGTASYNDSSFALVNGTLFHYGSGFWLNFLQVGLDL